MSSRPELLLHKRFALLFTFCFLLCSCMPAAAQEPGPALADMIARANALTDLSSAGPYEIRARIIVGPGSPGAQQGEITIYRDHERSRTELQLGDFHQVEVIRQGARYVARSRRYPVIGLESLDSLEDVVHLRTSFPPETKFSASHRQKVNGEPASCFEAKVRNAGKMRFCFNAGSGAVVEASDYLGCGRFSRYAATGQGMFPGRMELKQPGKPRNIELSEIQVTSRKFDDASFAVPKGAQAFAVCDGMSAARPILSDGWASARPQQGEIYLYAVVEADGRAHDMKVYGHKWEQGYVVKLASRWGFYPAQCSGTAVASEMLLPLVRVYPSEPYSSTESLPSSPGPAMDTHGYNDQYDRQMQDYKTPPY
jgi:hypothetical protein